jgi:hypothetical protein
MLRRVAKPTQRFMGTGLPFIFQVVLLILSPLALVYLVAAAALLLDLLRAPIRHSPPPKRGDGEGAKEVGQPHIGNFSQ